MTGVIDFPNIEEAEVSFCNASLCGGTIKIIISELDLILILLNINWSTCQ